MTTATRHPAAAGRWLSRPGRRAAARIRKRSRRATRRGDGGGATVELVIAVPLLMFMILLIAQAAVWMHATHVAQAAATRALDAAAANTGSVEQGRSTGQDTLTALGSGVLRDPQVTVTRTATDVQVEITGTAATVVPGITWTVKTTAAGKVERFVPDLATSEG